MLRFIKLAGKLILGTVGVLIITVIGMILWNSKDIVECPAFDENLSSWFPYRKGQVVTYATEQEQTKANVVFVSMRVQHRTSYNSKQKCGTCGDVVKATFKIGADTLVVATEKGNAMFNEVYYTNLNGHSLSDFEVNSTTMKLQWADSISVSGITAVCFKKQHGMVWYKRNNRMFYRISKVDSGKPGTSDLVVSNVGGCQ